MKALLLSGSAAGCSALSSLVFRKNNGDSTTTCNPAGYLCLFYLSSFILSFFINFDIFNVEISYPILTVGICVGILSSTWMLLIARALKLGPAGLTFAFLNASAIFPGLILFMLLGSDFGFSFTFIQLVGIMLVLAGLFLGAKKQNENKASSKWLLYTLACFIAQILALTCIQARCVLFDCSKLGGIFTHMSITEAHDVWFMPGQFGASFVMQAIVFFRENKNLRLSETIYGGLGGIANFASTYLLLLATKFALPFEKGILFPVFAVGSLILCNIWANLLYKEKFNIKTNALCSLGIFLAASA